GHRRTGRDARRPPPPMRETDRPVFLCRGFAMILGFLGVRLHGQQTGFQLIRGMKLVYFHLIFKPFHPRSPPPTGYVEGPAPDAASSAPYWWAPLPAARSPPPYTLRSSADKW